MIPYMCNIEDVKCAYTDGVDSCDALCWAIDNKSVEMYDFIIKSGLLDEKANNKYIDEDGITIYNNYDIVAKDNILDYGLTYSCEIGDLKWVNFFIEKGATDFTLAYSFAKNTYVMMKKQKKQKEPLEDYIKIMKLMVKLGVDLDEDDML